MIPKHGAYALYRNNTLVVVVGYNLETNQAVVVYCVPEVKVQEAEDFVEAVAAKEVPKEPGLVPRPGECWMLYGLPTSDDGPISLSASVMWLWEALQDNGIRTHP